MSGARTLLLTWLGLLMLLGASAGAAALLPGTAAHAFSLACAVTMAGLVMGAFMGLRQSDGLLRLFALGGLLWLGFLLFLTLGAFLSG